MVRVHDPQFGAYIAAQPDPKPSRPEAIRLLLADSLTGLGYLPKRDDPEMADWAPTPDNL